MANLCRNYAISVLGVLMSVVVIASALKTYNDTLRALKVYRESNTKIDSKGIIDACNDIATAYGQSFGTDPKATPATLQAVLDSIQAEVSKTLVHQRERKQKEQLVVQALAQVKAMDFTGLMAEESAE